MSHILKRVVLTGGPCGGKSTTIRSLEAQRSDIYCAPEAATLLLSGGFPAPTETHAWNYGWQRSFQTAVAATQLALESVCELRAIAQESPIIIYDRGLLDGASYLQHGVQELEEITGITEADMLARYDIVLHLPSLATKGLAHYSNSSNPHRFEEIDVALQLEHNVREAWKNHPNRHVVSPEDAQKHLLKDTLTVY